MTEAYPEQHVVTVFLRHDAEILFLYRSAEAGSYPNTWGGIAGHAEGDPEAAMRAEIREETGLDPDRDVALVRRGDPFTVTDERLGRQWVVHPALFDAETRDVTTNDETAAAEWVSPSAILRRETVPELWTSYDRVRPRVETIEADREHGSTSLSVRALAVLREKAALAVERETGDWETLRSLAAALQAARPSMPVVENRVRRATAAAATGRTDEDSSINAPPATPEAMEAAATAVIDAALTADERAAAVAAARLGPHVATLSRSETVLAALVEADPETILVAESRPGREGIATAERLADRTDAEIRVTTDAALAGELVEADVTDAIVGADAILADGRIVNKVGTRALAAAAATGGIDCYAVAARDKCTARDAIDHEPRPTTELYDGDADLTVANPTFEATPAEWFDAILTERGPLVPDEIADAIPTETGEQ